VGYFNTNFEHLSGKLKNNRKSTGQESRPPGPESNSGAPDMNRSANRYAVTLD
jgi:hypothetical protein